MRRPSGATTPKPQLSVSVPGQPPGSFGSDDHSEHDRDAAAPCRGVTVRLALQLCLAGAGGSGKESSTAHARGYRRGVKGIMPLRSRSRRFRVRMGGCHVCVTDHPGAGATTQLSGAAPRNAGSAVGRAGRRAWARAKAGMGTREPGAAIPTACPPALSSDCSPIGQQTGRKADSHGQLRHTSEGNPNPYHRGCRPASRAVPRRDLLNRPRPSFSQATPMDASSTSMSRWPSPLTS